MPEATAGARTESPGKARGQRAFTLHDRDFRRIVALIRARAGIHLGEHKRDMVYSRLARRLRMLGLTDFHAYLDLVEDDEAEAQAFVNALTTNLTAFFREPHHFDTLAALLRENARPPATIWCCAASTGEEPYSIAMTACEAFGSATPPVRVLATDIDTQVLETAAAGVYPLERIASVSPERRRRFFLKGSGPNEGLCRVKPELRALVEFRPLNLLDDDYGLRGGFAAVFCRNVMIYFDKPTQRAVLARIVPLLAPGAPLFAGHSESFTHAADLVASCGRTTYHATERA
ncbi:CheR family methyltransferase [Cognatiluteimonas weifangensis]|uniref:Chemotaxis protein methyltransferase n=1 Tax=Cognatiluteimonas weifangensis TaxID=2303539 RepID=A0A372DRP4_9GAMM|nr:CheR family methyltransferase [Luteimonas weifangensis]RFP62022.1 chemotaxis protein CheR [Luteimonas weifangensis]